MPDWTYQTLFRPVFFRMSPRQSQGIAIGGLGRLGDFWLGRRVVNFMGHMTPDRSLAFQSRGCYFVSRVALGCGLDAKGIAVGGFNQFGLALLEYGPLHQGAPANAAVDFDESRAEIRLTAPEVSPATGWLDDLPEYGTDGNATPLFLRFSATASIEFVIETIRSANQRVSGVILSHHHWEPVSSQIKSKELEYNGLLLLLMDVVSEPQDLPNSELLAGVRVDGALREGFDGRVMSHERLAPTVDAVKRWRSFFDNLNQDSESDGRQLVIAGGGVHEPLDALKLVEAGADIIAVDSGMVFAGPGLAKRCNELLVQTAFRPQDIVAPSTQPVFAKNVQDEDATTNVAARQSWLWSLLMGISMLGGGMLALVIALTRVVLPYDESVVGMTREQLLQVNDRLLDFMSHDRVTLAGAMLSVGTQSETRSLGSTVHCDFGVCRFLFLLSFSRVRIF